MRESILKRDITTANGVCTTESEFVPNLFGNDGVVISYAEDGEIQKSVYVTMEELERIYEGAKRAQQQWQHKHIPPNKEKDH